MIQANVHGLRLNPRAKIEDLLKVARRTGKVQIPVITPNDYPTYAWLEYTKAGKNKVKIVIDTYPSGCDTNENGCKQFFTMFSHPQFSEGVYEKSCGPRVMAIICVKEEESEALWFHFMLTVLENQKNIHDTLDEFDDSEKAIIAERREKVIIPV